MATLTVNPAAGTGGASVDGQVARDSVNENWATIRAGAGTSVGTGGASQQIWFTVGGVTGGNFNQLTRFICTFDTSALTSGATISAATIGFYGSNVRTDRDTPGTQVVASTPAASNNLANGDYNQLGSVAFSTRILNSSWSTTGYNSFALNASGITNISKTGVSKFGVVESEYDLTGSTPPGFTQGDVMSASAYTADNGSSEPQIVITYTVATNTGGFLMFM